MTLKWYKKQRWIKDSIHCQNESDYLIQADLGTKQIPKFIENNCQSNNLPQLRPELRGDCCYFNDFSGENHRHLNHRQRQKEVFGTNLTLLPMTALTQYQ